MRYLFYSIEYEHYYAICEPHNDYTYKNIDDDLASFFDFFFISTTSHNLESCINHIKHTDKSDKSEKV